MDEDDYDYVEYEPEFMGCTCDHSPQDHGWIECNIDGCDCEGCWVE